MRFRISQGLVGHLSSVLYRQTSKPELNSKADSESTRVINLTRRAVIEKAKQRAVYSRSGSSLQKVKHSFTSPVCV